MNEREKQLATALREVCMAGLTSVSKPRDAHARAALRRASLHGNAVLKLHAAAADVAALAPGDPRPEPPTPDLAPAAPAMPEQPFKARLPYAEDD